MNKYQKLPLTLECQLDTLRRRGLIIEDYDYACDQLSKIGYFRLANYCTDGVSASKLYAQLCCLAYLQNVIHPDNDFVNQLKKLLSKYPNVDVQAMGFPTDWSSQPLWSDHE